MAFLNEQGVARLWSHITDKIEESNKDFQSNKNPLELALFFYSDLNNFDGDTAELKAQNLARYDVIVYQGQLTNNLEIGGMAYARDMGILSRALEINPNLKVFGYLTVRGFANSTNGQGYVGMTEYRTSPANVDHPIWTKEELYAYMNLMAHVGGDYTGETDAYGNPVLEGGFPLAGVFFDDYGFHFKSQNEQLLNQGEYVSRLKLCLDKAFYDLAVQNQLLTLTLVYQIENLFNVSYEGEVKISFNINCEQKGKEWHQLLEDDSFEVRTNKIYKNPYIKR